MKPLFQFCILFFSLILIFTQLNSAQQDIVFENISIPDGLSSNIVFCVYEDQFGILWIGTGEGINRYDGYSFKSYKNDPDDSTSLSGNQIFQIIEDSEGKQVYLHYSEVQADDQVRLTEGQPVTYCLETGPKAIEEHQLHHGTKHFSSITPVVSRCIR